MKNRFGDESELVLLLHGFGAKRAVMWPIAIRLRRAGFRVIQWNYHSLFQSIETHAQRLSQYFSERLGNEKCFHIIAHSMGSIVARAALNGKRPANFGRMVLLAPPNHGSPVATMAGWFVGSFCPPTRELSDREFSYVKQLPESTEIDIGVLAARYDLLVPSGNTHLKNERQHETILATHNSLLFSRSVCQKAVRFLESGVFSH